MTSPLSFSLTEKELLDAFEAHASPKKAGLELENLAQKLKTTHQENRYSPRVRSQWMIERNKQSGNAQQPSFPHTQSWNVEYEQAFPMGMQFSLGPYFDKRGLEGTPELSTLGLRAKGSFDLWKNLLGSENIAGLKLAKLEQKQTEIETAIRKQMFKMNLRKMFWSWISTFEKERIIQELLESDTEQVELATRRNADFVAKDDEVLRYQAQIAQRKASLVQVEYQRVAVEKSILEWVPGLNLDKPTGYDIPKTIEDTLACTNRIRGDVEKLPTQTSYAGMVLLLQELEKTQVQQKSQFASPSLKAFASLDLSNKDTSYGDSLSNYSDDATLNQQFGFELSIPLGGTHRVEKIELELAKKSARQAILEIKTMTENEIKTILPQLQLLLKAVEAQSENSEILEKTLQESEKKLEQARIDIEDLIRDRNALLSSRLATLETYLNIIHIFLDFFSVFDQTNCSIARL